MAKLVDFNQLSNDIMCNGTTAQRRNGKKDYGFNGHCAIAPLRL
jgi:hypothetical protein